MSKNKKPFNVYEYGDGSYAYFAVVTKNYDDSDKPAHFNEIQVQAVPYGVDYTAHEEKFGNIDTEEGKVWLPYLTDLVGYDTTAPKESAKNDTQGYGFHHLPEVGSLVIVLAVEDGFPGFSQHIVIGNFWNKQLMPPQLDRLSYSIAKKYKYNMKHLGSDKDNGKGKPEEMQALANTPYYRTKAGTTFIRDELKGVFGFYRMPKKKDDAKKKNKLTSYFMFDEWEGNLDIKVNTFSVTAKKINIRVKNNLEINNKDNSFLFGTNKGLLDINTAGGNDPDGLTIEAKDKISIKGKKVNLNKGNPPKDVEPKKPRRLEITSKTGPDDEEETPEVCNLAVRKIIEINVLRRGKEYIGNGKTIRLDKGVQAVLTGRKSQGNLENQTVTCRIQLTEDDVKTVLALIDEEFKGARMYAPESVSLEPSDTSLLTPENDGVVDGLKAYVEQQKGLQDAGAKWQEVRAKLKDLFVEATYKANLKAAGKGKAVDVVWKIIFSYSAPEDGESFVVRVHCLNLDDGKTFPGKAYAVGDRSVIAPAYDKVIELTKSKTTDLWGEIVKAHSSELAPLFTSKSYYVNVPASLGKATAKGSTVSIAGAGDYFEVPGVVKFTVSAAGVFNSESNAVDQLNVTTIKPAYDVSSADKSADKFTAENYAKFNVVKGDNKAPSAVSGLLNLKSKLDCVDSDPKKGADVYVIYKVVRSLPVFLFCRSVVNVDEMDSEKGFSAERKQNIKNVNDGIFPIFEDDVYGETSAFKSMSGNVSVYGNSLWTLTSCASKSEKYRNLLNDVPENEGMLYIEDSRIGRCKLAGYLKGSDAYSKNADKDNILKYKYERNPDKPNEPKVSGTWKIVCYAYSTDEHGNIASAKDYIENEDRTRKKGGVKKYYKYSTCTPCFSKWIRIDEGSIAEGIIGSINSGGINKDFFENVKNYSFAFISTYKGKGSSEVYRSPELEAMHRLYMEKAKDKK